MSQNALLEEHKAFLEVYRSRVSRARQVKRRYHQMRAPLQEEADLAAKRLKDLDREYVTADEIIEEYTCKEREQTQLIAVLEKPAAPTSTRKKRTRLQQLQSLQEKLKQLLEEDPTLIEYL